MLVKVDSFHKVISTLLRAGPNFPSHPGKLPRRIRLHMADAKQEKCANLSAGVQKEISALVKKEMGLKGVFSRDFGPIVERG